MISVSTMANTSDGKRVSKQKHELNYTGGKVAKQAGVSRTKGKKAVKKAKGQTGSVNRKKVEKRAKQIVR
jgi:hypothetical protein